jgi:hypothetical protein
MRTARDRSGDGPNLVVLVSGAAVRWTVIRLIAVIAFLLGTPALSMAAPCGAGSLQSYIDLEQGGCTIGGLLFNNFDYTPSADLVAEIPASDVTVGQDFIEGLGSGLIFSANWDVTNGELDGTITYDVTVVNKAKNLTDETLLINGATLSCNCSSPPGDGLIDVTEDTGNANLDVFKNKEGAEELDTATFPGVASDFVTTELDISAGPFSTASIQSTSNLFSVVPEPTTWAMMLIGFAGLGWAGYRQRHKLAGAASLRLRKMPRASGRRLTGANRRAWAWG